MRTVYAQKNKKIILGRQGEDRAVRVVWPGIVSEWSSLYGDGSFQLSVRRFGDENAYPVVVEVSGDDIRFTVTSAETAIAGNGKCELTYIANGTIAKSATWETVVLNSLTGQTPSEPPEEPAKSWFTAIQGQIGNLNDLQTTSKDTLVAAINEAAQSGGGGGASVEPAEDDIPKVFFGGALQQTKDEVVVPFRYISKTQDISGYAEIKAQGNSSMSYPKKNQTVKLYKDAGCTEKLKVDFKGWGEQNKHVYKANWIDITHARNVVSARLWADVVKSRTNYAELPELLRTSPNQGAMDGFPIKVYANGVYQGRYTLNIPKDKWAFNMDDALDNHCVLCGENYVSGCFRAAANINESDWTDEIHVTVPASIKTRWNEVISFVMNSTDEEFKANLGNYFDVESLLDYHLFGLVSCGLDAYGKNQIYMTYDGQKWIASMYDMDSTWGLWWTGESFVATNYDRSEYQDFKDGEGNLLYIRLEELFYKELQARWEELRSGALSIENIINRFERFTDIAPAELVKEDYASTTGDGAFAGIPSKTTSTIQQIRGYAVARHAWCDTYVAGLTPSKEVPCTGITLSASTLTFTEAGSQTLVATVEPTDTTDSVVWSVDDNSIATVSGGVVTAVSNGSCTITATCGEQSATCAVSVSGVNNEGVLYRLASPTTFDGVDDYIDTGVALFDTNKDFTVCVEFAGSGNVTGTTPVVHCINEESPLYPGISIGTLSGSYSFNKSGDLGIAGSSTEVQKYVITKSATDGLITVFRDGGAFLFRSGDLATSTFENTLHLGCMLGAGGVLKSFWSGTINTLEVYDRTFSMDESFEWLGITLANPLYSFENGTYTDSACDIEVKNGNSVRMKRVGGSKAFAIISDVSLNTNTGVTGNTSSITADPLFSIRMGDKVHTLLIPVGNASLAERSIYAEPSIGVDFAKVNSNFNTMVSQYVTATKDSDVKAVCMYSNNGGTDEFELRIYVNGVRYI